MCGRDVRSVTRRHQRARLLLGDENVSRHDVQVKNRVLIVSPPLQSARARLLSGLHSIIAVVTTLPRLSDGADSLRGLIMSAAACSHGRREAHVHNGGFTHGSGAAGGRLQGLGGPDA